MIESGFSTHPIVQMKSAILTLISSIIAQVKNNQTKISLLFSITGTDNFVSIPVRQTAQMH